MSDNTDNIDILCTIDAENLGDLSRSRFKPTKVDPDCVFMIVRHAKAISGDAGANLRISANLGDNLRWRAMSLSCNLDLCVTLYNFVSRWTLLTQPVLLGGYQNSRLYTIKGNIPVEGPLPLQLRRAAAPYHYFQSTVQATGEILYEWWFKVTEVKSGKSRGCGKWGGVVNISN